MIHRIANLVQCGCASDSDEGSDAVTAEDLNTLEYYVNNPTKQPPSAVQALCALHPVAPWSICAITFTNKAAGEIKARLEKQLGSAAADIWAGTFHSVCVRFLRRDIERLGFSSSFTIYDTDDSLRVIKEILKTMNLDDKMYPPRSVLGTISNAKDSFMLAQDYAESVKNSADFRALNVARIYHAYERRLWEADALDFDDIILHTVRLLREHEDVRRFWQRKFRYVLVDEYQDTNHIQYMLSALLAGGYENICVVGDDDQSIYRFRGATIENILSFESQYRNARVIRLEQNYRSTDQILGAANAVIANNSGRKGKHLWTQRSGGEAITVHTAMNEHDEAQYVASRIIAGVSQGMAWNDFAVLYRMNAQSNQLEYAFKRNAIPYVVYGGMKFFDRAEVKDMLAYLCVIHNPSDDLRLRRIINTPARGIGAKTVDTAQQLAAQTGRTLFDVISNAAAYPDLAKQAAKLNHFTQIILSLRQKLPETELTDFYDEVIAASGYITALEEKQTLENRTRIENVQELKSSIQGYLDNAEEPSLAGFLDEVSLYTDLDSRNADEPCVSLMTIHSAKGLEFPKVFLVGMEETMFPGTRAIGEREEMEEERRLCYVAITRAMDELTMTCANQRMLFGRTNTNRPSRFVREIPSEYLKRTGRSMYDVPREEGYGYRTERRDSEAACSYARGSVSGVDWGEKAVNRSGAFAANVSARTVSARTGAKTAINLKRGEMVAHDAFGDGMVISVTPMGGDALLEIAFDSVGTKRLMYKSASSHMKRK